MDKIKQYSKFDRIFWGAGEIPTVPPSEYKSDGTWTNFDIAKGEIVLMLLIKKYGQEVTQVYMKLVDLVV